MRVLVDADACPVKNIIESECIKREIEVIMFIDTSHELYSDYSKIVMVSKGIDSVDLKIVKDVKKGDIVVTNDFGLASILLTKGAYPISPNGLVFDENNIERLLFERHLVKESVRKKKKHKKIKKRTTENDESFLKSFVNLIEQNN